MNLESACIEMLTEELSLRKQLNPKYSLRAFARDLNLSPSYISQVLNKKTKLNEKYAYVIVDKLKWEMEKANYFLTLVKALRSDSIFERDNIMKDYTEKRTHLLKNAPNPFGEWKEDPRAQRWYVNSILELAKYHVPAKAEWMGSVLNLDVEKIDEALKFLTEKGLIKHLDGRIYNV